MTCLCIPNEWPALDEPRHGSMKHWKCPTCSKMWLLVTNVEYFQGGKQLVTIFKTRLTECIEPDSWGKVKKEVKVEKKEKRDINRTWNIKVVVLNEKCPFRAQDMEESGFVCNYEKGVYCEHDKCPIKSKI